MKVITVIQPWATLLVLGEKKFETRSWSTKYRGELGIHASKKVDNPACRREPFRSVLAKHGYDENNLPTGVILAKSMLCDCFEVIRDYGYSARLENHWDISGHEHEFGDYTPGRFAWELMDVQHLAIPIPAKGQLGLWNWKEDVHA